MCQKTIFKYNFLIILSGTGKKVVSTQGKGFNNADSEISRVLFKMSLLTSDDLIENAIVNKIVLTLLKQFFFASELFSSRNKSYILQLGAIQ